MRVRLAVLLGLVLILSPASTATGGDSPAGDTGPWTWPVPEPVSLTRPYAAPAHEYGPGHRGIDMRAHDGGEVRAPADGVVAFVGQVADRRLVTIDHGDGLVSTLEPVVTELAPGTTVRGGETLGTVSTGGHTSPGELHLGVRRDGEYINPLLLLGQVPRAVLLPCC